MKFNFHENIIFKTYNLSIDSNLCSPDNPNKIYKFFWIVFFLFFNNINFMSKNTVDIEFRFGDSDTMQPDLSELDKDKQNMKYLADCFSFELNNSGDVEIEKYEVIDNGLKNVKLSDDKSYLDEFPMPIVRFYLKEMPKDIDEFRKSVWESAYIFTVPGLNDDDPHIYEDYSGKTRVVASSK